MHVVWTQKVQVSMQVCRTLFQPLQLARKGEWLHCAHVLHPCDKLLMTISYPALHLKHLWLIAVYTDKSCYCTVQLS